MMKFIAFRQKCCYDTCDHLRALGLLLWLQASHSGSGMKTAPKFDAILTTVERRKDGQQAAAPDLRGAMVMNNDNTNGVVGNQRNNDNGVGGALVVAAPNQPMSPLCDDLVRYIMTYLDKTVPLDACVFLS